jgi:hypothetical protein
VKKLELDVLPRRGHGKTSLIDGTGAVLKLAATPWNKDFTPVLADTLEAGLRRTAAKLRPAAKTAVGRLRAKKLDGTPDDIDVEACYAIMLGLGRGRLPRAKGLQCDALGSFWARRSPSFAVEVCVRMCDLAIDADDDKAFVVDEPLKGARCIAHNMSLSGNQVPFEAWRGLRYVLAATDDDGYELALQRATQRRPELDPVDRCLVSFAFPTEREWAADDADVALKYPELPKYATPLFATELDPTTAKQLAERLPDEHYLMPFLGTAADIHGAGIRGILSPLLKTKPRSKDERRALEAVLG